MTLELTPEIEVRLHAEAERNGMTVEGLAEMVLRQHVEETPTPAPGPTARGTFDAEKTRAAGARIRELRRGVRLDRQGISIRDLAHLGHKY